MIKKYSINFIGCGRLGQTIAFLLKEHLNINCILTRSKESANAAVNFIGVGTPIDDYSKLTQARLYLIGTNDDEIETSCQKLAATEILQPGDIVFHCSGSLSSDILSSAHKAAAITASIHPSRSFANPAYSISEFAKTFCSIEGDPEAVIILTDIFHKIGAKVFQIDKKFKTMYHAAACIASNYLITLSFIANKCYQQAGIPEETAKQIVNSLMDGTLTNLTKLSHKDALSGPIARGDVKTITSHMAVLENQIKEIYSALGKYTLTLTTHNKQEQLLNALDAWKHATNQL